MREGSAQCIYRLLGDNGPTGWNTWEKVGDIGSSRNAFGVANTGGFKSGFGLGVRIKTPIGPIMLDYGIPLNKEPGEDSRKSGKLHFNVSHGF